MTISLLAVFVLAATGKQPNEDWVLFSNAATNKNFKGAALLAKLRDNSNHSTLADLAKEFECEIHDLKNGATLLYPTLKYEKERQMRLISLIKTLSESSTDWVNSNQLPKELSDYVCAQAGTKSDQGHLVSLVPVVNFTVGGVKFQSAEPRSRPKFFKSEKFGDVYENSYSQPYSLKSVTVDSNYRLGGMDAQKYSKVLIEIGGFFDDLFKALYKDLDGTINRILKDNKGLRPEQLNMLTYSGRKVKDLPDEVRFSVLMQHRSAKPGTTMNDINEMYFKVSSAGFALGMQTSYGGSGVGTYPLRTVSQ
jgi:hypothetical protein